MEKMTMNTKGHCEEVNVNYDMDAKGVLQKCPQRQHCTSEDTSVLSGEGNVSFYHQDSNSSDISCVIYTREESGGINPDYLAIDGNDLLIIENNMCSDNKTISESECEYNLDAMSYDVNIVYDPTHLTSTDEYLVCNTTNTDDAHVNSFNTINTQYDNNNSGIIIYQDTPAGTGTATSELLKIQNDKNEGTNNKTLSVCHLCHRAFHHTSSLKRHLMNHNNMRNKYKCKKCEHMASCTDDMKDHCLQNHPNVKLFPCPQCGYTFKRLAHLQRHIKIHGQDKNVKCPDCDYTCIDINYLRIHSKKHTQNNQFKCSHCNKMFHNASTLEIHMRGHLQIKPYACNLCNFVCSTSGTLTKHKRIHSGHKPFHCNLCDYKCTQSGTLSQHKLTHSQIKAFSCDECSFVTARKHRLKMHKLRHVTRKERNLLKMKKKLMKEESSPFHEVVLQCEFDVEKD